VEAREAERRTAAARNEDDVVGGDAGGAAGILAAAERDPRLARGHEARAPEALLGRRLAELDAGHAAGVCAGSEPAAKP
jgi:hypothetical protein